MCFIKRKELKKIQSDIAELTNIVKTQELVKLRKANDDFKLQTELLKDIKFKVKSVKTVVDDRTGLSAVRIQYEIPDVFVELDEEGRPLKNKFFYASNYLELISYEDMEKIQHELDKSKLNGKD